MWKVVWRGSSCCYQYCKTNTAVSEVPRWLNLARAQCKKQNTNKKKEPNFGILQTFLTRKNKGKECNSFDLVIFNVGKIK